MTREKIIPITISKYKSVTHFNYNQCMGVLCVWLGWKADCHFLNSIHSITLTTRINWYRIINRYTHTMRTHEHLSIAIIDKSVRLYIDSFHNELNIRCTFDWCNSIEMHFKSDCQRSGFCDEAKSQSVGCTHSPCKQLGTNICNGR